MVTMTDLNKIYSVAQKWKESSVISVSTTNEACAYIAIIGAKEWRIREDWNRAKPKEEHVALPVRLAFRLPEDKNPEAFLKAIRTAISRSRSRLAEQGKRARMFSLKLEKFGEHSLVLLYSEDKAAIAREVNNSLDNLLED